MDKSHLLTSFGIDLTTRVIALVGAGGKTSLMYALAREMQLLGHRVVSTTTTRIFPPSAEQSPNLLLLEEDPELISLPDRLSRWGHVTVGQAMLTAAGKVEGIFDQGVHTCARYAQWVVVEADGAAGRPVKAPEAWEPVIPAGADLVIVVAGLDCLGKPASPAGVFRLQRFLKLTGLEEGNPIGPEHLAKALTDPEGGVKGVLPGTYVVPFLNKADLLEDPRVLEHAVQFIFQHASRIQRVVTGCLKYQSSRATTLGESPRHRGHDIVVHLRAHAEDEPIMEQLG
jgi:probable selenium-dependent hydroxylase accessory protein YqeC